MEKPCPGYSVDIVDEDGNPVEVGEIGEIVLANEDVVVDSYWGKPIKSEETFGGKWFRTGDLAHMDEDGYIFFKGRADDLIISSGYRIGPFEVESCLVEHEAVNKSAVVGIPHQTRGEIVGAFVVLGQDYEPSEELKEEIKNHVKERLAKHEYPRELHFIDEGELPMTPSGKIQRYKLRERVTD